MLIPSWILAKKKREDKYTKMREKITTSESEKYVKPKYYRT